MTLNNFHRISKTPAFWGLQILAFIICTFLALHLYPKAFPILDLQIKMNRQQALSAAKDLASHHHWGPVQYQQAIHFNTDNMAQTFIELEHGGSTGFAKVLKTGLYYPYTWKIRHFAESKLNETQIQFTPDGTFYGFREKLPENEPGPVIPTDQALQIAKTSANREWGIDLFPYQLIEKSQDTKTGGRLDHTFVYERSQQQIGEGRYRLKFVVSGDRLTEIQHFIKVPDGFIRRYSEMRSKNNVIANISSVTMAVLYLLGGCGLGIFFLARRRWVLWKTPLLCGIIVATFQVLEQVNQLPLLWMSYDTALSKSGFLMKNATSMVLMFFLECILLTVSFMAAESLSRKAFPNHPQFWRMWSPKNASSLPILGRTLGGYLSVGFFFAFVVLIYITGTQYFGWWSPSDILFHPDGLASYCPWFTSLSNSLHAGFWEESLFRAVPLAGAALLGERFGNRKKWITAGFIIQVLIFAAAHANYPAQPSYARVIELIIPSSIFGGIYLIFGLLPGIILHFTFDVVSFSIPLFAAQTPGIWVDRGLVLFLSLIPLWVVAVARFRTGHWTELSRSELNSAWQPPRLEPVTEAKPLTPLESPSTTPFQPNRKIALILGSLSVFLILIWMIRIPPKNQTLPLQVNRSQAIQIAQQALIDRGIHLSSSWEPLATSSADPEEEDQFIWQTEGETRYRQLSGNYLNPPFWMVRFVRFDTNVEERAEEYQVFLAKKGEVFRVRHELPEARSGADLQEKDSRQIAFETLRRDYRLDEKSVKSVSSIASKLPARKDWLFIFSDPAVSLKKGEARIGVRIAGNESVSSRRFIHVPEEWSRQERNRENILSVIRSFCTLAIAIFLFGGILNAIIHWTRKEFNTKAFLTAFGSIFSLGILVMMNGLPSRFALFSTTEPRMTQIITLVAFGLLKYLGLSILFALIAGYVYRSKWTSTGLTRQNPQWIEAATGFGIGTLGTMLTASVLSLLPSLSPTWGRVSGLNYAIPPLAGLSTVELYIMITLTCSLAGVITHQITRNWTRYSVAGMAFLVLLAFSIAGTQADDLLHWLISGSTIGIVLAFSYRYLIRSNFTLIPFVTCALLVLSEMRQILLHPYTGIVLDGGIAIVFLILASFAFSRIIHRLSESAKTVTPT